MIVWALLLYVRHFEIKTLYYSIAGLLIAITVWSFGWIFKNHPNPILQKIVGYNDYRSIVWDPRATWRTLRIFLKWMFINVSVFTFGSPHGVIKEFSLITQNPQLAVFLYPFYSVLFVSILAAQGILMFVWFIKEFPQRKRQMRMKSSNIVYAINILTFIFVTAFLSVSLPTEQYYLRMDQYWFSLWYVIAGVNVVPRLLVGRVDAGQRRILSLKKYQIPEYLEKRINDELDDIAFVKSKWSILIYALYLGFFYQFARVTWTTINFYVFLTELSRIRCQRRALHLADNRRDIRHYEKMSISKLLAERNRLNQVLEFSEVMFGSAEVQKGVLKAKQRSLESKPKLTEYEIVERASFTFEIDRAESFKQQSMKIRHVAQSELSNLFKVHAAHFQKKAERKLKKKMGIEQKCFKLESKILNSNDSKSFSSLCCRIRLSMLARRANKVQLSAEQAFNESLTQNMRSAYFMKEAESYVPMKIVMKDEVDHLAKMINHPENNNYDD